MSTQTSTHSPKITLLRGINVGGRHLIPMTELRLLCERLGWSSVRTCLQTGNVISFSDKTPTHLERELEHTIESQFGFSVPVLVRTFQDFERTIAECPFVDATKSAPSQVILYGCKAGLRKSAQKELQSMAETGEQIRISGEALWIYFPNGIGRSALTPARIDKAAGSPATGRNWKTLLKIKDLASAY